jgi:hypothetical protein
MNKACDAPGHSIRDWTCRKETNRLLQMIDEDRLPAGEVVLMCVKYMSEDDVADMMDCNELTEEDTDDE